MNRLLSVEREQKAFTESGNLPIRWVNHPSGYNWETTLCFGEIILVLEGSFSISFNRFFDHPIGQGSILLLPPGSHFKTRTARGVSVCVFRLDGNERLCRNIPKSYNPDPNSSPATLQIKTMVKEFLLSLKDNYEKGLTDSDYLELKKKELFYLLSGYYTAEELSHFFHPLMGNNSRFMDFVWKNYKKVRTVIEFAALYNSSVSNFEKKFRLTFGISPYKWMNQRRIDEVYQEVIATDKPIGQIAEEQKFLSLPQFTDYCKKHLGYPPGKLRRIAGYSLHSEEVLEI